jgi:carboxyl-terminal processing protease
MQNNNLKLKTYKFCAFGFDFSPFKASLIWLAVFVFYLAGCQISPHPAFAETSEAKPAEAVEAPKTDLAEPNTAEIPAAVLTEPNVLEEACELIYKGNFDAAGKLIESSRQASTESSDEPNAQSRPAIHKTDQTQFLPELAQIVHQYQAICQQRQEAREAEYKERLAELEKLSTEEAQAKADTNDAGDVNNISEILSVITRACEPADNQQKQELLSRPYVKQTIQKAIDKAAEYESQGKWLDAYIASYSWLQAIEPNNKEYSDYANKLVEKASIAASFQDSPCETSEQRFDGVTKHIFIWAINAVKANYNEIIDYKQMATKAIKQCQLMGEVAEKIQNSSSQQNGESESAFSAMKSFRPKAAAAWSAALTAVLAEVEQSPTGFDYNEFIDVFEKVLALNETTIELPQPILIAQFAETSLSTLDPYTVVVWPKQMQDFQKTMTNEFTGIGVEIMREKGLLTVVSLLPDTPAYNSGLDAGDVIEKVDGAQTKDMTLTCAVHKITGPKGTKVTLTINRPGEEKPKDITITRARITVPTIRGWQRTEAGKWRYIIDEQDKIGYVQLTSFSEKTSTDLEQLLRKLEGNLISQKGDKAEVRAEGLNGLILDLRFNSGGLLDSAVAVVDKFIKGGLIVKTERGFGRGLVFEAAHTKNTHPNYPLVVLINSNSASASEIVAGALADAKHNRAILVGQRTHGKGSVQGILYYPTGTAQLKYTMAYYHLPSGQRVESREAMEKQGREDWGVGPDVEVKLTSSELKKMLEVERDNSVLTKADHDNTKGELKKYTIEETLAADPQLAVGLLIVKCKLTEAKAQELARAG